MTTNPSPIRADHNPKFYSRFLLIGLGMLAFALYCVYDGAVAYPNQHERYSKYVELRDDLRGDEWEDYAEQQGWPLEPPEKDRTEAEIAGQFWMAGGCALIGVFFLLKVLLARGRWMESDGAQLTTSWGQTVPYDAVTEIDKKKWANKGIARIKYTVDGQTKRFVLDDFKFHRQPTDAILYEMEQAAGTDKIVNGAPEVDPEEVAQAEAELSGEVDHDDESRSDG